MISQDSPVSTTQCQDYSHMQVSVAVFCGGWVSKLKCLCLHRRPFTNRAISPGFILNCYCLTGFVSLWHLLTPLGWPSTSVSRVPTYSLQHPAILLLPSYCIHSIFLITPLLSDLLHGPHFVLPTSTHSPTQIHSKQPTQPWSKPYHLEKTTVVGLTFNTLSLWKLSFSWMYFCVWT